MAANTSGRGSPPSRSEVGRERGGAGRVVRGVEQQLAAVGQPPDARAGPATTRSRQAGRDRARAARRCPARSSMLEQRARRRPRCRSDGRRARADACTSPCANRRRRRSGTDRRGAARARGAALARDRASTRLRIAASPTTTGTPGLMMPAFSPAIVASVVPRYCWWSKAIEVIAVDGRRCHDVGGVEPAAEADLEHRDVDAGAAEQLEGDRGRDFEERRLRLAARRRRSRPSIARAHVGDRRDQRVARSTGRPSIDEPLGEIDQVRRGVARRAVAGGAQRRVDHRRDRALAVGAGDVDRRNARSGWPSRRRWRRCSRGRT